MRIVDIPGGVPLPMAIGSRIYGAAAGGALHVVGSSGPAVGESFHIAIDAHGQPGPATRLGLVPLGISDVGGRLLVTGLARGDGHPTAQLIDAGGRLVDAQALPIDAVPACWPTPVRLDGDTTRIVWEVAPSDGSGRLEWVDWDPGGLGARHALEWSDRSRAIAATASDGHLLLLRLHGTPARAEWLRIARAGHVAQRVALAGVAMEQIASAGGHVVVPLADARTLRLARFDAASGEAAAAVPIAAVEAPLTIRAALLLPAGHDGIVVGWRGAAEDPGIDADPASLLPVDRIVYCDVASGMVTPFGPAEPLLAAARLDGDRLVVVSGGHRARTTVHAIER